MQTLSRSRTVVALAVVAAVAVVALLIVVNKGRRGSAISPRNATTYKMASDENWREARSNQALPPPEYELWDEARARQAVAEVIHREAGGWGLSRESAQRLAAATGDVIAAYWTSDLDRYASLLASQQLTVDEDLRGANGERTMRSLTRSLVSAPIDYDRLRVILVSKSGNTFNPVREKGWTPSAKRRAVPRGEHDVLDPSEANADVVAVWIPAWLLSSGVAFGNAEPVVRPFEGALALYFARRPADGEWLLIQVESHSAAEDPDHSGGTRHLHPVLPPL